jgi:hypothetical protein
MCRKSLIRGIDYPEGKPITSMKKIKGAMKNGKSYNPTKKKELKKPLEIKNVSLSFNKTAKDTKN